MAAVTVPPGPLAIDLVMGRERSCREPLLVGEQLLWAEQRPDEGGRTTLMLQQRPGATPKDLTPGGWSLRTRVHEFGGGLFCADSTMAVFIDGRSGLPHSVPLQASADPRPLIEPALNGQTRFADGLIDTQRQRWIGVMESDGGDSLVSLPLAGGNPQVLRSQLDFCGYAVLSPSGDQLAWLEWSLPWMPWERTELWWSWLGEDGELLGPQRLAGGDDDPQSLFQPLWTASDQLLVASDRMGYWTPQRWCPGSQQVWESMPLPSGCECGMPQWVYGMRTLAACGERLLALACREGAWSLWQRSLKAAGAEPWQEMTLPFCELSALTASTSRAVCLAAGVTQPTTLLEIGDAPGRWQAWERFGASPLPASRVSVPRSLWVKGGDGHPSQAWFYPPAPDQPRPCPLLVRGHSGPTGMARTGLSLAYQYWISRGWAVVDVNYGGSTGFGRAYRERLDGRWGELDVADCAAAVSQLIAAGEVDPERVAIEGGSAGGFTTLAALIHEPVFKAGVCRYPVCDLASLQQDTHRFESGYFDRLIGPWPQQQAKYHQRSPLQQKHRLGRPVLFIQGLQDKVVPPEQTELMVQALRQRGLSVELILLEAEAHGFRSGAVQRQVLEATERFFERVLPPR